MRTRAEVIDKIGIGCSEAAVAQIVRGVLESESVEGAVAVVYVDEQTIADLNGRYRGQYETTDVLCFGNTSDDSDGSEPTFSEPPVQHGPAGAGGEIPPDLGEVIICPAVVLRYAVEDGRDAGLQLGWTIIHGVLHLLGFDHERDGGVMRRREQELLEQLGHAVSAISLSANV